MSNTSFKTQKKQVIAKFQKNGKGFFKAIQVRNEVALFFFTEPNIAWAGSKYYPVESAPLAVTKWL